VIAEAAAHAHTSQAGGLFMLGWGLFASAFGLAMVTNFRGFADTFARRAAASSAGLRKRPPWMSRQQPTDERDQVKLARLIAIPFAIVGPVLLVAGIISISQGRIASTGASPLPSPFRYLFIAFAVVAVGQSWLSRRGIYRPAARRGGWWLAIAVLSSLGALIFGVSVALGQLTIGFAALLIGGLPSILLLMDDKPTGPGPGDAGGRQP
jgi:hypothetical protein